MDHQPNASAPKPRLNRLIIGALVCLGVMGMGSRMLTAAKMNTASAEPPEVQELANALESLQQNAIKDLDTNPDAIENYQAKHTEQLEAYLEANTDDNSVDAFLANFVLSTNRTAPDTTIVGRELEWIMDFSTVKTTDDLVKRANRLRELDQVLVDMTEWLTELPNEFDAQLWETDYPQGLKKNLKNVFLVGTNIPGRIKIQEQDQRLLRLVDQMLQVLHRTWGRWEFDSEMQMLVFDEDEAMETFNSLVDSIDALGVEQLELQREILSTPDRYR